MSLETRLLVSSSWFLGGCGSMWVQKTSPLKKKKWRAWPVYYGRSRALASVGTQFQDGRAGGFTLCIYVSKIRVPILEAC